MARYVRHQNSNQYYFVSNRCLEARYFLNPDTICKEIILGCLARYIHIHRIEIVGYMFMSNHFHLIVRCPNRNLHLFMKDFQGELARRINRHRGRSGTVFPRRYSAEPILDHESMRQKIQYMLNNPIKDNIVTHIEHWGGINSFNAMKTGNRITGKFFNYTTWRNLRRKNRYAKREDAYEYYTFNLTMPPYLQDIEQEQARKELVESIESHRIYLRQYECSKLFRVMQMKRVIRRHWNFKPANPKNSPRPICHAACKELRRRYIEFLKRISDQYRQALKNMRERYTDAAYPEGTIPPGWSTCI